MTTRVQRWDEHRHMPWLGGGGSTAEIARFPAEGDFDWRLSIADVTGDGPFSTVEGVDRTIINLGDVRMALTVDGVRHELTRFEPFAFDGGASTTCEVSAPTRDFNVMTRRGRARAEVGVHRVTDGHPLAPGTDVWLVVLDGTLTPGGSPSGDPAGSAALVSGDAVHVTDGATLAGAGTVVVVRLSPA